jgi:hypothetical protein
MFVGPAGCRPVRLTCGFAVPDARQSEPVLPGALATCLPGVDLTGGARSRLLPPAGEWELLAHPPKRPEGRWPRCRWRVGSPCCVAPDVPIWRAWRLSSADVLCARSVRGGQAQIGSYGAEVPCPEASTVKSCQVCEIPLSSCSPRSWNTIPDPATRSTTVRETYTSPGRAHP